MNKRKKGCCCVGNDIDESNALRVIFMMKTDCGFYQLWQFGIRKIETLFFNLGFVCKLLVEFVESMLFDFNLKTCYNMDIGKTEVVFH